VTITPDGIYGSATATAVLAYKRKRDIVNRTVQATADNIVGKMTMTTLDREMQSEELKQPFLRQASPAPRRPAPRRGLPKIPPPPTPGTPRGGAVRSFSVRDAGAPTPPPPTPARAPAFIVQQVIVTPGRTGTIIMNGGKGGSLVRWQDDRGPWGKLAIANLQRAKVAAIGSEEIDVVADPETFTFTGQNVGETWFQWFDRAPSNKRSAIASVLVLVPSKGPAVTAEFPVDTTFKSGLMSTDGVPLNPRQGRKINIFGRGESNGFENYSTDLPFCNDTDPLHRPWTDDPRKPNIGIADKSVQNICCRSSPILPVTIDEIKRIAAPGCRVTYVGGAQFVTTLRAEFIDKGLATKIDEGPHKSVFGIIFEIK